MGGMAGSILGAWTFAVRRQRRLRFWNELKYRPSEIEGRGFGHQPPGWLEIPVGRRWLGIDQSSGTEPVFRIYGEAEDDQKLIRLQQAVAAAVGLTE